MTRKWCNIVGRMCRSYMQIPHIILYKGTEHGVLVLMWAMNFRGRDPLQIPGTAVHRRKGWGEEGPTHPLHDPPPWGTLEDAVYFPSLFPVGAKDKPETPLSFSRVLAKKLHRRNRWSLWEPHLEAEQTAKVKCTGGGQWICSLRKTTSPGVLYCYLIKSFSHRVNDRDNKKLWHVGTRESSRKMLYWEK